VLLGEFPLRDFGCRVAAQRKDFGEVCELRSPQESALAIVRVRVVRQVLDLTGGERGTRTLDLGIMSADLKKIVSVVSTTYRVASVAFGTTKHNRALPGPAKVPRDLIRRTRRCTCSRIQWSILKA
jgi:hypothetical protein